MASSTSATSPEEGAGAAGGAAVATTAAERRAMKAQQVGATLPPVEQDPLPCPRCNSTTTKFCYYNNYNFSQPRHFCKSCRRYWTHGGALRDIPVGGGTRKATKRPRTMSPAATSSPPCVATASPNPAATLGQMIEPIPAVPISGFTGLLALGGFGLGLGLDDVGYGLGVGRGGWSFPTEMGNYVTVGGGGFAGRGGINVNCGGAAAGGSGSGGGSSGGDDGGYGGGDQGGYGGGECFSSMPELAISTTGNGRLK